jgi:hypothetical protein
MTTYVDFTIVATTPDRLRLVFGAPMLLNAALANPASYALVTALGAPVSITGISLEGLPVAPTEITVTAGSLLNPGQLYAFSVTNPAVQSVFSDTANPNPHDFAWQPEGPWTSIPWDNFAKGAPGGILEPPPGPPRSHGMVFFSPAFDEPVPNSIIQVDSVRTCTTAEDSYQIPPDQETRAFYTFGGTPSLLNANASGLFIPQPQIRQGIEQFLPEAMPHATSSHGIGTLVETLDSTRVTRLNGLIWPLFNNVSTTPFILAANLTPIPPGVTTVVTLEA